MRTLWITLPRVVLLVLFNTFPISVFPNCNYDDPVQDPSKQFRSSFRYAIVNDKIVNVTGDNKDAYRYVEILLDEKAFSEQTLRELFKLVSARFPMPNRLDVQVFTNLEQVETLEEREQGKVSELPYEPTTDRYHRAILIRSGGNELFRFSIQTPVRELKTVILKGRDPGSRE